MRRKISALLGVALAMTMALSWAIPALAHVAPMGANTNALNLTISRPAITYHVGDVINYSVTVLVPVAVGINPTAHQTGISTTFTDPTQPVGNVQAFPVIASLLPGESVTFTATGATYLKYDAATSVPPTPRADLVAGTAAMPGAPAYVADIVTYAGAYPLLNYTIMAGDLVLNAVTANAQTGNVNGAHVSAQEDSANAGNDITTQVSQPDTAVSITPTAASINSGDSTTLTVTEQNTGNVALTTPSVVVLKNALAFVTLVAPPTGGDTGADGILGVGETWTWSGVSTGALTATTVFEATGHGFDNSTPPVDITFPGHQGERASTTVTVNQPSTIAHIVANPTSLPAGGGVVTLVVTEFNNGTIPLSNVIMTVTGGTVPYTLMKVGSTPPAIFVGGDTGNDGILGVGETWSWSIPGVPVLATTTFTVNGDGTYGSPPVHVNFSEGFTTERDAVTVTLQPPPPDVPAASSTGMLILTGGLAAVMALFVYRRARNPQS